MTPYITNAEGDAYFDERLNVSAWTSASEEDKTKAAKEATRTIDQLNFRGKKAEQDQELQFPRYNDSSVPDAIKWACAEVALALLDGVDPDIEYANLRMVAQGYGNVRSTYDVDRVPQHILAGIPSIRAWRFLLPFLRDPHNIKLNRI